MLKGMGVGVIFFFVGLLPVVDFWLLDYTLRPSKAASKLTD